MSLNLSFFQRQKKWNPKKQTPVFWTGGFLELPQKNLLARDTVLPQKFALPPPKKKDSPFSRRKFNTNKTWKCLYVQLRLKICRGVFPLLFSGKFPVFVKLQEDFAGRYSWTWCGRGTPPFIHLPLPFQPVMAPQLCDIYLQDRCIKLHIP